MDIQKELEEVQADNRKLFQSHQELLKQVQQFEQKIQQNNGVIIFLQEKIALEKAEQEKKAKNKK